MSVWYNQTTFLPNVVHCYSRAALSILTKTVGFFKKSGYMMEKEKIIVAADHRTVSGNRNGNG